MANVVVASEDVGMRNGSGELQVAVGDGAVGLLEADELIADLSWKPLSPHYGLCAVDKPDATHSFARSIVGAYCVGELRHKLGEMCGAVVETVGEPFKVVEVVPHGPVDLNPVPIGMG